MSFFIAELEDKSEVSDYFSKVLEKKDQAMISIQVQLVKKNHKFYWLNLTSPKIPPIYYFTLICLGLYLFSGWWVWLLPMGFFALSGLLFWRGFHSWAFKKGLKKSGYKGNIKILDLDSGVEEVFFK